MKDLPRKQEVQKPPEELSTLRRLHQKQLATKVPLEAQTQQTKLPEQNPFQKIHKTTPH